MTSTPTLQPASQLLPGGPQYRQRGQPHHSAGAESVRSMWKARIRLQDAPKIAFRNSYHWQILFRIIKRGWVREPVAPANIKWCSRRVNQFSPNSSPSYGVATAPEPSELAGPLLRRGDETRYVGLVSRQALIQPFESSHPPLSESRPIPSLPSRQYAVST